MAITAKDVEELHTYAEGVMRVDGGENPRIDGAQGCLE